MTGTGISLQAYLVIDNCVLVMLHEYFCERQGRRHPPARLMPAITRWMNEQLSTLQLFAPDGRVHCTDCVADEFYPGAGRLSGVRGIEPRDCRKLAREVCALLHQTSVRSQEIDFLRHLPAAPRKLVGPSGLSDNDLSLVVLGLHLLGHGDPVYVLTNDQDLLSFITWLRSKPEARQRWGNLVAMQGLQSLTYLELIHRDCKIQTNQMEDLINFYMFEHFNRRELAGTNKGNSILMQLIDTRNSLTESVRIKLAAQGALA
jgi:hypothetical protein